VEQEKRDMKDKEQELMGKAINHQTKEEKEKVYLESVAK
jgi:hypothetical protein